MNHIIVRAGKGNKDRVTLLPAAVKTDMARHRRVIELGSSPDRDYLQWIGVGTIGFSRALGVASPKYIRQHYEAYGGPSHRLSITMGLTTSSSRRHPWFGTGMVGDGFDLPVQINEPFRSNRKWSGRAAAPYPGALRSAFQAAPRLAAHFRTVSLLASEQVVLEHGEPTQGEVKWRTIAS